MVPPVATMTTLGFLAWAQSGTGDDERRRRRSDTRSALFSWFSPLSFGDQGFGYRVGSRFVSFIGSSRSLICASVRIFFSRMTSRMPLPLL